MCSNIPPPYHPEKTLVICLFILKSNYFSIFVVLTTPPYDFFEKRGGFEHILDNFFTGVSQNTLKSISFCDALIYRFRAFQRCSKLKIRLRRS